MIQKHTLRFILSISLKNSIAVIFLLQSVLGFFQRGVLGYLFSHSTVFSFYFFAKSFHTWLFWFFVDSLFVLSASQLSHQLPETVSAWITAPSSCSATLLLQHFVAHVRRNAGGCCLYKDQSENVNLLVSINVKPKAKYENKLQKVWLVG